MKFLIVGILVALACISEVTPLSKGDPKCGVVKCDVDGEHCEDVVLTIDKCTGEDCTVGLCLPKEDGCNSSERPQECNDAVSCSVQVTDQKVNDGKEVFTTQVPQENHSEWRLLYFISFLLLVGFFVLNMFVGVVVENFHRCREEQEREEKARRAAKRAKKMAKKRRSEQGVPPSPDSGSDGDSMDESERKLAKMRARRRREMHEPPYYINYSKPRLFIHSMVVSKYFDLAIAAVIGLNVVTMAMEFYRMPQQLAYTLNVFNYFFTAVFVLELTMKLAALGVRRYCKDKWNQLDVFIVILSMIGIVFEEMESKLIPINPTIIRVMRVLRIARVLKLLKMAKGIRALLDTVMQALPQVGNLGLLFFLLFFIFAALGVELFGRLECSDEFPCQGLSEHAHFRNFGIAFLTLFRVATGDNWNGIMKDTLRTNCDKSNECVKNCCVSNIIAPIFFVVFVLMAQFVLVNVVVAVLMKHLEESHKQHLRVERKSQRRRRERLRAAVRSYIARREPEIIVDTSVVGDSEAGWTSGDDLSQTAEEEEDDDDEEECDEEEDEEEENNHQDDSDSNSNCNSNNCMEDELDMEAELEQELAAEEALAELQDQWTTAAKAIEAATDAEFELAGWGHRPLGKMNSLPANFTFPSTKATNGNGNRASVCGGSARCSLVTPLIPLVAQNEASHLTAQDNSNIVNNVNIRQLSPDDSTEKVSVADLQQIPLVRIGSNPEINPDMTDSVQHFHSLPSSQCHLDSTDISPDCTSAAVTLVPPSYPAQSFPSSPENSTLPEYSEVLPPSITLDVPSPPMSPSTIVSSSVSSPQSQHQLIVIDTDSSDT